MSQGDGENSQVKETIEIPAIEQSLYIQRSTRELAEKLENLTQENQSVRELNFAFAGEMISENGISPLKIDHLISIVYDLIESNDTPPTLNDVLEEVREWRIAYGTVLNNANHLERIPTNIAEHQGTLASQYQAFYDDSQNPREYAIVRGTSFEGLPSLKGQLDQLRSLEALLSQYQTSKGEDDIIGVLTEKSPYYALNLVFNIQMRTMRQLLENSSVRDQYKSLIVRALRHENSIQSKLASFDLALRIYSRDKTPTTELDQSVFLAISKQLKVSSYMLFSELLTEEADHIPLGSIVSSLSRLVKLSPRFDLFEDPYNADYYNPFMSIPKALQLGIVLKEIIENANKARESLALLQAPDKRQETFDHKHLFIYDIGLQEGKLMIYFELHNIGIDPSTPENGYQNDRIPTSGTGLSILRQICHNFELKESALPNYTASASGSIVIADLSDDSTS